AKRREGSSINTSNTTARSNKYPDPIILRRRREFLSPFLRRRRRAGNGQPHIAPYSPPYCYANGYQPIPVYNGVAEGRPLTVRMQRLPCCGLGIGWFLFIIGFFLAAIPWYVGAFILLCVRVDYREKPGFAACTIAAVVAAVAVIVGATKHGNQW
ncbi:60S ribosomal protein L18a-like protein, partial [Asparagus officinalis]|uniref:60S ribosomal protein L18a-like protein n=1 Tax=Asparagus officinalis TaxID=4686 RepID=UPI00098E5E44